jgi:hypothetical protein
MEPAIQLQNVQTRVVLQVVTVRQGMLFLKIFTFKANWLKQSDCERSEFCDQPLYAGRFFVGCKHEYYSIEGSP